MINIIFILFIYLCASQTIAVPDDQTFKFRLSNVAHHLVKRNHLNENLSIKKSVNQNLKSSSISVGIVGAGISGLYAAILLQDLGIKFEVLEASNYIGGRCKTVYFNQKAKYSYVEMGAMRFPNLPVFDRLIGKQNWSLISYLNNKLPSRKRINLIPFISSHPNNLYYFNGKMKYKSEVDISGDLFGFSKNIGGFIDEKYTNKSSSFWLNRVLNYIKQKFNGNQTSGFEYLIKNDYKTLREFMMDTNNPELAYPSDVVDWIEDFQGKTGVYSYSLMDIYLQEDLFSNKMFTIDGGVSKLIFAMRNILRKKPLLKHAVKRIRQLENKDLIVETTKRNFKFSHLILTPTFQVLRDIDFDCNLHLKNRIAMRVLNGVDTVKIGLLFKTRFWENSKLMNGNPIFGGESDTDLKVRRIEYPSYGINCSECSGPILAAYSAFKDASKFLPLNKKQIVDQSLDDLSKIHGNVVFEQFTGKYKIIQWSENKWIQQAFSAFEPGHFSSYLPYMTRPDANGRLHFAGEQASIYHAWLISSLNSAYRAVKDILLEQGMKDKISHLESMWGTINEPDISNFL